MGNLLFPQSKRRIILFMECNSIRKKIPCKIFLWGKLKFFINSEWHEHLEINHSPGAIEAQHFFADFFVNEARKNNRGFNNSKEEKKDLISSFYSIPLSESFLNVYIFTKPPMRDLFKLNIHSKKFLGFIQNFRHNNTIIANNESHVLNISQKNNNSSTILSHLNRNQVNDSNLGNETINYIQNSTNQLTNIQKEDEKNGPSHDLLNKSFLNKL